MFRMARNNKGMRIADNAAKSIPDVLVANDQCSTVDAIRKSREKAKKVFGHEPQIIFALLTKGTQTAVQPQAQQQQHDDCTAPQLARSTSMSSERVMVGCRCHPSAWTWRRPASSTHAGASYPRIVHSAPQNTIRYDPL